MRCSGAVAAKKTKTTKKFVYHVCNVHWHRVASHVAKHIDAMPAVNKDAERTNIKSIFLSNRIHWLHENKDEHVENNELNFYSTFISSSTLLSVWLVIKWINSIYRYGIFAWRSQYKKNAHQKLKQNKTSKKTFCLLRQMLVIIWVVSNGLRRHTNLLNFSIFCSIPFPSTDFSFSLLLLAGYSHFTKFKRYTD